MRNGATDDLLLPTKTTMKRLSLEAREQHERKMRAAEKKANKLRLQLLRERKMRLSKLASSVVQPKAFQLAAPQLFCIETNESRNLLLPFLAEMRAHFLHRPQRPLVIDFTKTRRFVASGTLLFYAELKRLVAFKANSVKVRCKPPFNDRARQVLKQIGVYGLCGYQGKVKATRHDVVHWRVAQGHLVDNSLCGPVIEQFEGQLAAPIIDDILGGLSEAMNNTKHHAHIGVRNDGLNYSELKDWWMFSQVRDGYLTVVFCDLGIGIPATLPIKMPLLFRALAALGLADSDADCINEAVKDSRSRTREAGRGHGLGNIINVVENAQKASVHIYSNKGCYKYHNGKQATYNCKISILGTLIYWSIPFNGNAIDAEC